MRRNGDADEILTTRLRLRRAQPTDLDSMHAMLSNEAAMRYWSHPPHASPAQTRAWLETMTNAPAQTSEDFIVEHDDRVIGKAGCYRLPEIGFILHPAFWGMGLAREALAAIIPAVFARHAIAAIQADVDPRNLACLALLTRLGFSESHRALRTWHVGGVWCDSVYLASPRPSPS